jgi:hypothetical protein
MMGTGMTTTHGEWYEQKTRGGIGAMVIGVVGEKRSYEGSRIEEGDEQG